MSRTLLGIAGAPGAGKSTYAAAEVVRLGPSAVVLPMDGFHLPQAELRRLGRRDRMGAPDTFAVDGFVATLEALRRDEDVRAPAFDRTIEEPVPDAIAIGADIRVVIVEGNYLLHDSGGWEAVREELDLVFFVEVPRGIRLHQLIERHVRYGKSPDAAEAWALGPDEDNARLIEGTSFRADHVIRLD